MEIQVVRVVGNGPEVFYAAIGSDAHQDDAVLGVPGYAVCVIVKHSISGGIDLIIHIHDTVVIIEWEYCKATRSVVWVEIPHFVVCAIDLVEPVVAGERFALCGVLSAVILNAAPASVRIFGDPTEIELDRSSGLGIWTEGNGIGNGALGRTSRADFQIR